MFKTKFDLLSKEDKKKLQSEFYNTKAGKKVRKALLSSIISSVLCSLYGIYLAIDNYITNKNSIINFVYSAGIFIIGIILIIYANKIRTKRLSLYMVKNKKII